MRLPGAAVSRILASWPVARLATLDASGRAHLVPVVFALHAGALWSPIDAKPKSTPELARVRNLRRDPRATLLIDDYRSDWSRLWWIRLDLLGEVLDPDRAEPHPDAAPALGALRAKYPQYDRIEVLAGGAPLLRFRIERTTTWCAGTFFPS